MGLPLGCDKLAVKLNCVVPLLPSVTLALAADNPKRNSDGAAPPNSKEPISQLSTRGKRLWSSIGQELKNGSPPVFTRPLNWVMACVCVGPPLLASSPRFMLAMVTMFGPPPQEVSVEALLWLSGKGPKQLVTEFELAPKSPSATSRSDMWWPSLLL